MGITSSSTSITKKSSSNHSNILQIPKWKKIENINENKIENIIDDSIGDKKLNLKENLNENRNENKIKNKEKNSNGGSHIYFSSSLYKRTHKKIPENSKKQIIDGEEYIAI